jgi:hypothetical protein
MFCSLDEILTYENQPVVRRFQKENPDKADRAHDIFKDLLRFFWGTRRHELDRKNSPENDELNFVFIMDVEMKEIDQMWHIFLLYTRDYMNFCQRYFGEYLHHQPDLVPIFEKRGFDFQLNLQRFLNYSFDRFGEATIRRWFAESATA